MLRFALPALLCLTVFGTSPAAAQHLELPQRSAHAAPGSRFVEEIRDLPLEDRERRIAEAILAGSVPSWLRTLHPIGLRGPRGKAITATTVPVFAQHSASVLRQKRARSVLAHPRYGRMGEDGPFSRTRSRPTRRPAR